MYEVQAKLAAAYVVEPVRVAGLLRAAEPVMSAVGVVLSVIVVGEIPLAVLATGTGSVALEWQGCKAIHSLGPFCVQSEHDARENVQVVDELDQTQVRIKSDHLVSTAR